MYISQDTIFDIVLNPDEYSTKILIWDQENFVKSWELVSTDKGVHIEIMDDYFVGNHFQIPESRFMVHNGILYQGLRGSFLQQKENKTEDLALFWEIKPDHIPIQNIDDLSLKYWRGSLIWQGVEKEKGYAQLMMLPCFNDPAYSISCAPQESYIEKNFFYYHDDNYIVYHWAPVNYGNEYVIDIVRSNGEIVQTLTFKKYEGKSKLPVSYKYSENGRYFATLEPEWEHPESYDSKLNDVRVVVYEITHNPEIEEFSLKEVRVVEKITEELNYVQESEYSYTQLQIEVLNDMSIWHFSDTSKRYFYEDVSLWEPITKEIKKDLPKEEEITYLSFFPRIGGGIAQHGNNVYAVDVDKKVKFLNIV